MRAIVAAGIGLGMMLTAGFLLSTNMTSVIGLLTGDLIMAGRSELGAILFGSYLFFASVVFFLMNWIAARKSILAAGIFWAAASVLVLCSLFFQPSQSVAQWFLPLVNLNGDFKFSMVIMPALLALGHYGVALRVPDSAAASLGEDVGEVAGDVF